MIAYNTAHDRVHKARGKARTYQCTDCPAQAVHWSYKGHSPLEIVGYANQWTSIMAWSPDPMDYEPRCYPCHRAYDEKLPKPIADLDVILAQGVLS